MASGSGPVKHLIELGDVDQVAAAGIGGDLALFLVEMLLEGIGPAQPEIIQDAQGDHAARDGGEFFGGVTRGLRAAANGGTHLGPGRGRQRRGRRHRGGEFGNDHYCMAARARQPLAAPAFIALDRLAAEGTGEFEFSHITID